MQCVELLLSADSGTAVKASGWDAGGFGFGV